MLLRLWPRQEKTITEVQEEYGPCPRDFENSNKNEKG